MHHVIFRFLLGVAAAIFGFGGVVHARAYFAKALPGLDSSNLPSFMAAEFKVLWLADSTTLIAVALLLAYLVLRPSAADRTAIMLLALLPAATAALLYVFLGSFYAAHMLMAASALVFAGGLMLQSSQTAAS